MANEVTISGTPLNPYLSDILEKTGRATVIGNVPEGGIYNIIATKTGTYAPVREYIDITDTGKLPDSENLPKGYRVVTREREQRFGRLYTYDEVQVIKKALVDTGSKWRIPTKEDWDKMLNSIEDEGFRNHNSIGEGYYGQSAAYALKGVDNLWVDGVPDNKDNYDFCVLPLGYADYRAILLNGMDGNKDVEGFGKCAAFWTDTKVSPDMEGSPIFAKYFWHGSGKVMQQALAPQSRLSLRLVRDFEVGFDEYEPVLGDYYHCGPVYAGEYDNHNASVWTLSNINTVVGGSDFGYISNEWEDTIDSVISFYINEWTGDRWLRHRMHEGDSVVVIDADGAYNHEWRIYVQDGEQLLLDSVKIIGDDVLDIVRDNLKPLVEEEIAPFESRITNNENNIASLSAISESQENEIAENRSLIEALSASVISSDEEIKKTIDDNKAETDEALDSLNKDVQGVSAYAISNVERIDTNVSGLTDTINSFSSSTVEELTRLKEKDDELAQSVVDTNERIDNTLVLIDELSGSVISNFDDVRNTIDSNKQETDEKISSLSGSVESFSGAVTSTFEDVRNIIDSNKQETDSKISSLSGSVESLSGSVTANFEDIRDTIDANKQETEVALTSLNEKIEELSSSTESNITRIDNAISEVSGTIISFSGSVVEDLSLVGDEIDGIVENIGSLSDQVRLNHLLSSANTGLILELSAATEDAVTGIYSSISAETDERKAEDEAIRQDTSRSLTELESRFQDYLSGATVKPEEIEQIKTDILAEVSKMLAAAGVPVYLTESEYNEMVSAGTVSDDTLYYVYEDEEEPVTPEESGTTGEINTDTGVLSLTNATVTEDVLVIDGGSIVDGVLTFGESSSAEEETTPTEVSDDGTATISNSEVDETTGTLSLNNGSVDENGVLTL